MNARRLTAADFDESARAAFDAEFDEPKERAGCIVMSLVLIAAGALAYAFWSAVVDALAWVLGE